MSNYRFTINRYPLSDPNNDLNFNNDILYQYVLDEDVRDSRTPPIGDRETKNNINNKKTKKNNNNENIDRNTNKNQNAGSSNNVIIGMVICFIIFIILWYLIITYYRSSPKKSSNLAYDLGGFGLDNLSADLVIMSPSKISPSNMFP